MVEVRIIIKIGRSFMNFTRSITLLFAGMLLFLLGACSLGNAPVTGILFTNVKSPITSEVGDGTSSGRTGRSCAQSILNLVAFGDASINAAKVDGKVTRIGFIDQRNMTVTGSSGYGVFSQYCTEVTGR